MKVIIFGASGMVGQGLLRECLLDPGVERILVIGRSPTGQQSPKLEELSHPDLFDLSPIQSKLSGYDACFFCLGVSSGGMSEADYHRLTYELTTKVAQLLLAQSPGLVFLYVSGAGTDSSEQGRSMWARVKGKTENALLKMPFRDAYMLRPGYIQPMHGAVSKTPSYRVMYKIVGPLYPLWKVLAPGMVTDTERLARAMLRVARHGAPKKILESKDLIALGTSS
jgi:uncharacterized protein YbjT (DUF2867 family)